MSRYKEFEATGIAPLGRLYAGDLLGIQDLKADVYDLLQNLGAAQITLGESGLALMRYGAAEMRLTGALRTDGILRGLGGIAAGAYTTTQRDAIPAGGAPFTLIIFNTTTNRYEWNMGSDGARNWQPLSPPLGAGSVGTSQLVDGSITLAKLDSTLISTGIHLRGTLAAMTNPLAVAHPGALYFAYNDRNGTMYRSDGTTWEQTGASVGSNTDMGTAFPTTGLFNGRRFTLQYTSGSDYYEWEFIYRVDLDATHPWLFAGGIGWLKNGYTATLNDTGSNHSSTLATWTMPALPGIWEFAVEFAQVGGSQTNAPTATLAFAGTGAIGTIQSINSSATPAGGSQKGPIKKRVAIAGGETITITLTGNPQNGEFHSASGAGLTMTPVRLNG